MRSVNLWPKWAANIEQLRLTFPSYWFHTPSLQHHPGMNHWWKLFRIGVSSHANYMRKKNDKTRGWNIWVYFRGGAALCFEFTIVMGLPRVQE